MVWRGWKKRRWVSPWWVIHSHGIPLNENVYNRIIIWKDPPGAVDTMHIKHNVATFHNLSCNLQRLVQTNLRLSIESVFWLCCHRNGCPQVVVLMYCVYISLHRSHSKIKLVNLIWKWRPSKWLSCSRGTRGQKNGLVLKILGMMQWVALKFVLVCQNLMDNYTFFTDWPLAFPIQN